MLLEPGCHTPATIYIPPIRIFEDGRQAIQIQSVVEHGQEVDRACKVLPHRRATPCYPQTGNGCAFRCVCVYPEPKLSLLSAVEIPQPVYLIQSINVLPFRCVVENPVSRATCLVVLVPRGQVPKVSTNCGPKISEVRSCCSQPLSALCPQRSPPPDLLPPNRPQSI